jgi:hypothetical protein
MRNYELRIRVFNDKYKKYYDLWDGKFLDDRQLFCNIYKLVLDAESEIQYVNNNSIHVAWNQKVSEEETVLNRIIKTFEDLNLVD